MAKKIHQLEQEIERLKSLAYRDELTGLYNRRGFKDEAEKFINEVIAFKKYPKRRESVLIKNFSLIVLDIDNFKKFNDSNDHDAGDRALKLLGGLVLERVRDIDIAARWGGEEFVIGLVGSNEDDALRIANDIRFEVAKTKFKWRGKILSFTVSGGVAGFDKVKNFEDMFHLADKALYQAKKQGKNMIIKA